MRIFFSYTIPRNPVWHFVWDAMRELNQVGHVMDPDSKMAIRTTHLNKVLTKMTKLSVSIQVTFVNVFC